MADNGNEVRYMRLFADSSRDGSSSEDEKDHATNTIEDNFSYNNQGFRRRSAKIQSEYQLPPDRCYIRKKGRPKVVPSKCWEPWMWLPLLISLIFLLSIISFVLSLYAFLYLRLHFEEFDHNKLKNESMV